MTAGGRVVVGPDAVPRCVAAGRVVAVDEVGVVVDVVVVDALVRSS
jgi:hypothetical protein